MPLTKAGNAARGTLEQPLVQSNIAGPEQQGWRGCFTRLLELVRWCHRMAGCAAERLLPTNQDLEGRAFELSVCKDDKSDIFVFRMRKGRA